jgi:hypothetical protein
MVDEASVTHAVNVETAKIFEDEDQDEDMQEENFDEDDKENSENSQSQPTESPSQPQSHRKLSLQGMRGQGVVTSAERKRKIGDSHRSATQVQFSLVVESVAAYLMPCDVSWSRRFLSLQIRWMTSPKISKMMTITTTMEQIQASDGAGRIAYSVMFLSFSVRFPKQSAFVFRSFFA